MATLKLTNRAIDGMRAKLALKRNNVETITLWDTELKGFGLRLSSKGKGSWLVYKRLGTGGRKAKQVLHVFGSLAEMGLEEARTRCLTLIKETRLGNDPAQTKRRKRLEEHNTFQSGKLKDVFEQYHLRNATSGRYWHEVKKRFEVEVLPVLGGQTIISTITRTDVRRLIEAKEVHTSSGARHIFTALRPFFKWAAEKEFILASPMDGMTPPSQGEARDRVLKDEEVKSIWSAASETSYPFGPYYKLLLLTAQRRDEVAKMTWSELDLDNNRAVWIIPKERTKNNKEHLVHLSPQAVTILKGIPKKKDEEGKESPYVFTTTGRTAISGYSKAKKDLDALAKIEVPWRVHDLRRTAATGMASLGFPPHVVERVLNHISGSNGGLVGVYQRFEYAEERKKALFAWANHIDSLVNGVQINDNVIPLKVV